MSISNKIKKIVISNRKVIADQSKLKRLNKLINEKREKGILPPKRIVPTHQDAERYGYDFLFNSSDLKKQFPPTAIRDYTLEILN